MSEPDWKRRFRAASVHFPSWARDEPDRLIYLTNVSGTFEVHEWDRKAGTHRQATDRPDGTGYRVPSRLDRTGTTLALETGLESGQVLRAFLDRFDTGGLGVNLDPANLLMNGFDPYESARALHSKIVHGHAKDARAANASRAGQEVPLGHGDIDWLRYLGVLEEINYRGWLTIERETGDQRAADVAAGVAFLRRFIAPL